MPVKFRNLADEEEKQATEIQYYHRLLRQFLFAAMLGVPVFLVGMFDWVPAIDTKSGQLIWLILGLLTQKTFLKLNNQKNIPSLSAPSLRFSA